MFTEDHISAENERLWSISTLQRQWEVEEQQRIEDTKLNSTIDEEHARLSYMEAFYSSQSSGGVLQCPWPTRAVTIPQPVDTNQQTTTTAENTGKIEYKYKEGYDILCSDFGNISTIHVNGLQRSQEVSMGGQTAEGSQAKAIAALAMRPVGTRNTASSNNAGKQSINNLNRGTTAASNSSRQGNETPPSPTKEQQQSFDSHDQQAWQEEGGDDGLSAVILPSQSRSPMQKTRSRGVNLLELGPRYVKGIWV